MKPRIAAAIAATTILCTSGAAFADREPTPNKFAGTYTLSTTIDYVRFSSDLIGFPLEGRCTDIAVLIPQLICEFPAGVFRVNGDGTTETISSPNGGVLVTWKATGSRTAESRSIGLRYDANGAPVEWQIDHGEQVFSIDMNAFEGTVTSKIYPASADPNNLPAEPSIELIGTQTGQRYMPQD